MNGIIKRELALLDNLIYLDVSENMNGKTVDYFVEKIIKNGEKYYKNEKKEIPCKMSWNEWLEILNIIKTDPELEDLRKMRIDFVFEKIEDEGHIKYGSEATDSFSKLVKDMKYKGDTKMWVLTKDSDEDGIYEKDNAYVIFRGTTSDFEWADNAALFETGHTAANLEALELLKYLEKVGYRDVYVSGHSKGGNKSSYVTLFSNIVKECLAFDAPGFTKAFIEENQALINAKKSKLNEIAYCGCYVNPLLTDLVKPELLYGKNLNINFISLSPLLLLMSPASPLFIFICLGAYMDSTELMKAHSPNMVFNANGQLEYQFKFENMTLATKSTFDNIRNLINISTTGNSEDINSIQSHLGVAIFQAMKLIKNKKNNEMIYYKDDKVYKTNVYIGLDAIDYTVNEFRKNSEKLKFAKMSFEEFKHYYLNNLDPNASDELIRDTYDKLTKKVIENSAAKSLSDAYITQMLPNLYGRIRLERFKEISTKIYENSYSDSEINNLYKEYCEYHGNMIDEINLLYNNNDTYNLIKGDNTSNTYIFGLKHGNHIIKDEGEINTIKFIHGIEAEDILVTNDGYSLKFTNKYTNEWIVLDYFKLKKRKSFVLEFDDGTIYRVEDKDGLFHKIHGRDEDEKIYVLLEDTTVFVGKGNDTYIFGLNHGNDVVLDSEGINTIKFIDGIKEEDISVSNDWENLYLTNRNTKERITLKEYTIYPDKRAFQIEFADGSIHRLEDKNSIFHKLHGTDGNDKLYVKIADTKVYAGKGNDRIHGGKGNDTYIFGLNHGSDVVIDSEGINTIKFVDGITPNDILVKKDNQNLILANKNNNDSVKIENYSWDNHAENYVISFDNNQSYHLNDMNVEMADYKVYELNEIVPSIADNEPSNVEPVNNEALNIEEAVGAINNLSNENNSEGSEEAFSEIDVLSDNQAQLIVQELASSNENNQVFDTIHIDNQSTPLYTEQFGGE